MDRSRLLVAVLGISLTMSMTGCAHHRQSQSRACACSQGGACSCSQQGGCDCGIVVPATPACAPAAPQAQATPQATTEPAAPTVAPPPPTIDEASIRQPNTLPVVETSKPLDHATTTAEKPASDPAAEEVEFLQPPTSATKETAESSDPCSRQQTAQDAAAKPGTVQLPESTDQLPTPQTAEEGDTKLDAINLQRAIEAADLPVTFSADVPSTDVPSTDAPKTAPETAPQAFEPDAGARALQPGNTNKAPADIAPAASAPDPYKYSYPGAPSSRNIGFARTRSGVRIGNGAKQTPQYNPDARNLGELYQPHYSNGMMNQFRYGW